MHCAPFRSLCVLLLAALCIIAPARAAERPNILLAISDDQSFPHTSAYGYVAVDTPAFDRVAREGVLLTRAYCGSPGCSPSRAALLTGRHHWQLENAGTHASSFSARFDTYPDLLERAGYVVGYTGKGWGPGNFQAGGRTRNPAGPAFNRHKLPQKPTRAVSGNDYAANFAEFLQQRPAGGPFCFWYGGSEPHRAFEAGSGARDGGQAELATPPPFLPDMPEVRDDLLDYCREIEHFDEHLGRMLQLLEESGELDNTLVVVTSDNGMAFPRAKANCYEYGIHVPMAVRWPAQVPAGRRVADLVGFVDLAPTFLEAAGQDVPPPISGRSLLPVLQSERSGLVDPGRERVFSGRERHSSSRYNNSAYPQRAMRTGDFLLIRNFRPHRWPAGAPQKYDGDQLGPPHGAYHDIDACPTLTLLVEGREDPELAKYFHLAVDKRPEYELFNVRDDPACLFNLASDEAHQPLLAQLQRQLNDYLRRTGDPRVLDGGEIFETYNRYSRLRRFPQPE